MEPYGCPAIYVYLVWLSQVWRPQSTAVSWWWLEWATRTPPSPIKRDRKKLDNSPPRTVPCFCSFVKKDMLMCILLKVDHNWDGVRSSASSSIISLMSIDSVRTHYDIQELPQLHHECRHWNTWFAWMSVKLEKLDNHWGLRAVMILHHHRQLLET